MSEISLMDAPALATTPRIQGMSPTTSTADDPCSALERLRRARDFVRPRAIDYMCALGKPFVQLRGDRATSDDPAIVAGMGRTSLGTVMMLGHHKGATHRENTRCHGGRPSAAGYGKVLRLLCHADKFAFPVIWFLDSPGAYQADDYGQMWGVGRHLMALAALDVPIIAVVIGECDAASALALGLADRVVMLEQAVYLPEEPASADDTAFLAVSAADLHAQAVVDEIVAESFDAASTLVDATCRVILRHLDDLYQYDRCWLREHRGTRLLFHQSSPPHERTVNGYEHPY